MQDMTDGCGFANAPLLRHLRKKFEWEYYPVAIQCRLAGAKVVLIFLIEDYGLFVLT